MSNVRELDLRLSKLPGSSDLDVLKEMAKELLPNALSLLSGLYFGSFTTDTLFKRHAFVTYSLEVNDDESMGQNMARLGTIKRVAILVAHVRSSLSDETVIAATLSMRLITYRTEAISGSCIFKLKGDTVEEWRLARDEQGFGWSKAMAKKTVIYNSIEEGAFPTTQGELLGAFVHLFRKRVDMENMSLVDPFRLALAEVLGVTFGAQYNELTPVQMNLFETVHENVCSGVLKMTPFYYLKDDQQYLNGALEYVKELIAVAEEEIKQLQTTGVIDNNQVQGDAENA